MRRLLVFSAADAFLFELSEDEVFGRVRTEEINGEHALELTTTRVLGKGERILSEDAAGTWREYTVEGIDADHSSGLSAIGTYWCPWSVLADLTMTTCDRMPGTGGTPVAAAVALEAALSGTARWTVGTVTQSKTGGASMWGISAWEALGVLVDVWGGELDATVTVSSTAITSRQVHLYAAMGAKTATRRFDYGADVVGIRRKVADSPVACRIVPRGKGEETEGGGYGRKITIESVNGGKNYLQNDDTAAAVRLPNGSGGWEYPTVFVDNGDIETPAELLSWAQGVLADYTTPRVTYEADVLQLAQAGLDPHGVALGDAVMCVDRMFGGDGLRISGRVVKLVCNELDETDMQLTIGHAEEGFAGRLSSLSKVTATVRAMNGGTLTTADYLNRLLERLNNEINATGGYTYITEGQGIRTYNRAVTDPLVGSEATAVVEIKGGTIRIANSKTSAGAWNWRTVFTSGHIAADVVTAAQLTAGYIGSPSGNYWNLDTGELRMQGYATSSDLSGVASTASAAQSAASAAQSTASAASTAAGNAMAEAKKTAGATNLLIDTNNNTFTRKAADANRYTGGSAGNLVDHSITKLSATGRPVGGCDYAWRSAYSAGANGKTAYIAYYKNKAVRLVNGQTYTVSCWAYRSGGTASLLFQHGQTGYKGSKWTAVTTGWKRYSWTFTFDQSAVGGSGGSRIYFYTKSTSASASTVYVTGMKVELGAKASDWSASPEDESFGIANATAVSKAYTNEITALDRAYTDEQRQALDESLNQSKIFNRLTNNGRAQGLILNNGNLYINGTYIKTNTLSAGIIKSGLLKDASGLNQWNMDTGYMQTKNLDISKANVSGAVVCKKPGNVNNHVAMTVGAFMSYWNGYQSGSMSAGSTGLHIIASKPVASGGSNSGQLFLVGNGGIFFNGQKGFTGKIRYLSEIVYGADASTTYVWRYLNVKNGIIIGSGQ